MKRDEWKAMALNDRLHTMLAADSAQAGDTERAEWHIATRDDFRRQIDLAASIFCKKPVTGYITP